MIDRSHRQGNWLGRRSGIGRCSMVAGLVAAACCSVVPAGAGSLSDPATVDAFIEEVRRASQR